MDITIVGAGSLGSLLGGFLARAHDVTLVGREPHVSAVTRDGLTVSGMQPFNVRPRATTAIPDSTDLAVVAVKSYDTSTVETQLADATVDACLSVQNGMGNEETLSSELDCPVLAGICTYGARRETPGTVTYTGEGTVTLGPRTGGESKISQRIGQAFEQAGIATEVSGSMPTKQWEKLAVNAAINAATALARVENGRLGEGPGWEIAREAASEVARVARTQGIELPDERALALTRQVITDTARNCSSMYQDVDAGNKTEIDAINGYVVEIAENAVPVNRTLTDLIRTWEQSHA
jgi:2-dehydropantoate 2-reductase